MALKSKDMIQSYLLGQLTIEERVQIEERVLLDSDFFEQVLIVENELIDAYLEGSLSDKEGFVQHFMSTPQQRQKVKISMALREHSSDKGSHEEPSKVLGDGKFRSLFRFPWGIRAKTIPAA